MEIHFAHVPWLKSDERRNSRLHDEVDELRERLESLERRLG